MSTASTLLPSKVRRVGLRAQDYKGGSLHGAQLEKELPSVRQSTPEEDILRPPEGSSDEDSGGSDSEDGPAPKRRKGSGSEDSVMMESKSRLPLSGSANTQDTLTTAPSNIEATSFTSCRTRNVKDYEEPPFPDQASQSRRKKPTYTRKAANYNIHTNSSNVQENKKPKTSPAKTLPDAKGFLKPNTAALEAKCMDSIAT